ncbi:hypothetical protein CFIO01_12899 [Colletotrichum fioriniae PJ7]|uniref:Uncharacterized protein n=1 Tax=Colletotrichum fioriniae PJ7 TaxID=1445577 RepID=A0A010SJA3_9PEZI|nr:hypothetical protein CFIO01_12899 [Colletotrichum fioriniae PJ7]
MKSYIIPPPGSSILRAPTGGHVTGKSQENLNGKGPSPLLVHASQCLAFTPVLQRPPHSPATAQSTELASHSTAALPSRLLSTRLEPATANLTGLHRQPSNEPPRTSPRNPFRSRVRRRHTSDICVLIHRAIVPTAIDPLRLCRSASSSMSHN